MASAARPETTAVAKRVDARVAELRERNQLVAAIRGTQWGRDTTPEMARAVAHYCHENGLDPVRHVEILGGRIYLTAEFYDERGAELIRSGVVQPDEPDLISVDPRLDEMAKAGDEWAKKEQERRLRQRITHGVPEKALAAVAQRFRVANGATVLGVNWCGGTGRRDPVGDAEPTKTATTRARRRAWKQLADVIPGYGDLVKPIEARAKLASDELPVSVIDAPHRVPALTAGGYDEAPIPPAQHSDAPALTAEETEDGGGELPLGDDLAPVRPKRRDAPRES